METWKPVVDYEGLYEVSSEGRVRSVDRVVHTARGDKKFKSKVLNGYVNSWGYHVADLYDTGIRRAFPVHRIIAEAFIPNPKSKATVNHKDGNKVNNNLSNLEWTTVAENIQHAFDIGLNSALKGSSHPCSKPIKITQPNGLIWLLESATRFCKQMSLHSSNISKVARGERSHHKQWQAEYLPLVA